MSAGPRPRRLRALFLLTVLLPGAALAVTGYLAITQERRLREAREERQAESLLRALEEGLARAASDRLAACEARLRAALATDEPPERALLGDPGPGEARLLDADLRQVAPPRPWRRDDLDQPALPGPLLAVVRREQAGDLAGALEALEASPLAGLACARNLGARLLHGLGRLEEALAEDRWLQEIPPGAGLPLAWIASEREAEALLAAGRRPEAEAAAARSLERLLQSGGAGGSPGAYAATLGRLAEVLPAGPLRERGRAAVLEARLAAGIAAWGAGGGLTAHPSAARLPGSEATLLPLAGEPGWVVVGAPVRAAAGALRAAVILPRAALEALLARAFAARAGPDAEAFEVALLEASARADAAASEPSTWRRPLPGGAVLVVRAGESAYEAALAGRRAVQRLAGASVLLLVLIGGSLLTYRAAQRASELARLRTEFTASVTHELRTPVASIRAMSEILALGKVPSEERRAAYYRAISEETQRLGRLVEDVLDVARVESDGFRPDLEVLCPGEVVRAATDAFRASPVSKGLGVEFSAAPDLPRAALDRRLMARALENLLVNGVKYGGEQPDMRVEVRAGGLGVEVLVSDHGPGIDPPDLERVLRPFERGRGVADVPGAGLGLAIVAAILEAHGGSVAVESVKGMGTTFRLSLPAAEEVPS